MDRHTFSLIETDLRAQLALVDGVFDRLEDRVMAMSADDVGRQESVAYQLHNLYNALEELFKIVAAAFENRVSDVSRRHLEMLRRMASPVPGLRPALLSQEAFAMLNALRGFRHFFRHAYDTPLDYAQLQLNVDKARRLRPVLQRDVAAFLSALEQAVV